MRYAVRHCVFTLQPCFCIDRGLQSNEGKMLSWPSVLLRDLMSSRRISSRESTWRVFERLVTRVTSPASNVQELSGWRWHDPLQRVRVMGSSQRHVVRFLLSGVLFDPALAEMLPKTVTSPTMSDYPSSQKRKTKAQGGKPSLCLGDGIILSSKFCGGHARSRCLNP